MPTPSDPTTERGEKISEALDKMLLDVITKGVPLVDNAGRVVRDKYGKIVYRPAPASYLNVARQRVRDLGISKVPTPDDPIMEVRDRLAEEEFEPLRLPEIDEHAAQEDLDENQVP